MMLNKAFKDVRDETHRMLDVIAWYTGEVKTLEPYLESHLIREKYKTYWELGVLDGSLGGIFIIHHLKKEENFKSIDPLLSGLINEHGWEAGPTEDFYGYGKTFPFKKTITIGGAPKQLRLNVRVFAHSESTACKKVQVGTEPKYELRCVEA